MSGGSLIALEALLVLAVVFGFGGWELVSLRRERRHDEARRDAGSALGDPSGDDAPVEPPIQRKR